MIIGVGTDLLDARRIKKIIEVYPDRFLSKYFTQSEIETYHTRKEPEMNMLFLTSRFAAKEAMSKALGTGFQEGLSMRHIEVSNDGKGKPIITLHGKAIEILEELLPTGTKPNIHLSLTDQAPYAQAFVVIEAIPQSV